MTRLALQGLRVSGVDWPDAEISFGPGLTLITGRSDTGKTHIVECIDFALGAGSVPKSIPERRGYDLVALEVLADGSPHVLARRFSDPDLATIFGGVLSEWDGEAGAQVPVKISGAPEAADTLSGWLLRRSSFDLEAPVINNQRGHHQRLSFRTFAPMAIVDEKAVISDDSPILSSQRTEHTANRSIFGIVLTGKAPTLEEVEEIRLAHDRREKAKERLEFLDSMIAEVREEIEASGPSRTALESDLARLEEELAEVSEAVTKSGERARGMMGERNRALHEAEKANREALANRDLRARFGLLSEHYEADVDRLRFVIEGGHFFNQLEASHCPTCGRPIDRDAEPECHPESPEFGEIELAARAEIDKLTPRMNDLKVAIAEAEVREREHGRVAERESRRAAELDEEIEEVANPSAAAARGRVAVVTARRRTIDGELALYRDLDRYVADQQKTELISKESISRYRPEHDLDSLRGLSDQITELLTGWRYEIRSELHFDLDTDDIAIDGKPRGTFGKGVRAITHTGFTVGLMLYCLKKDTPHPGFVVLDSPLTPYKGKTDEIEDPELTAEVRPALLHSVAGLSHNAQAIIVENIDPPEGLGEEAVIHEFVGEDAEGRAGFYPISLDSD